MSRRELLAEPPAFSPTNDIRKKLALVEAIRWGITARGTSERVLEVIRTAPERNWSLPEIIDELETRGQMPATSDPRNVLQATLHRLTRMSGHLERIGGGLYRLT